MYPVFLQPAWFLLFSHRGNVSETLRDPVSFIKAEACPPCLPPTVSEELGSEWQVLSIRSIEAGALHYCWNELAMLPLKHTVWEGNLQACNYSCNEAVRMVGRRNRRRHRTKP